jgi:glucokinase
MPKARSKFTIGIDLGGTKIAAGLCEEGTILKKVLFPTAASRGFESVVAVMADACRKVAEDVPPDQIAGVGVGAAGQIDPATGAVLYAPNLGWEKAPLGQELGRACALPIRVVNDVRAATMAEWKWGNGRGCNTFLNVFIGTGIGSGLVVNGHLVTGATNSAGEIGHICLDPEGPFCGCGHRGCLEAFASGRGLENHVRALLEAGKESAVRELVKGDLKAITGPIIGQAARAGDALARRSIKRIGTYLGRALANVHTFINPDIILLGGGVMGLQEFFLDELKTVMHAHVLPVADRGEAMLGLAKFENDAVLLGGAALFA